MNKRLLEIMKEKEELRAKIKDGKDINLEEMMQKVEALNKEEKEIRTREKLLEDLNSNSELGNNINKPEDKKEQRNSKYDSEEYRAAFMDYVVKQKPMPKEFRENQVTKTTDVGAIIPPTTLNKIVEKLESYGNILPLVNRTGFASGLVVPTSSIKPVATWVGEGETSDKQKKTLGSVVFAAYKLRCAVAVSLETNVMTWSAFETTLINNIVEAMAIALENSIINGTGTKQPTGILKDDSIGVKIETDKISYDLITKAEGELEEAYEAGAVWCMNKKTFMQFVGMTDSNGQPIARVNYGINGRQEKVLLGRTVVTTKFMPAFSTGVGDGKTFAFLYNFKDYTLNTNYQMGIKTYEDDDTDDIIRKSVLIADGKVIDSNSLVKLVYKVASVEKA